MRGVLRRARPAIRVGFLGYAAALVVATHWPGLAVDAGGLRIDLFIHAGAFGLWLLLFAASGWFGPVLARQNVVWSIGVSGVYAVADELSQGIPIVQRTVDPFDLLANASGIVVIGSLLLWKSAQARPPDRDSP